MEEFFDIYASDQAYNAERFDYIEKCLSNLEAYEKRIVDQLGRLGISINLQRRPEEKQWKGPFTKRDLIGHGAFGSVYFATHVESKTLCVVREVQLFFSDSDYENCRIQLQQDIEVFKKLKHKNIMRCLSSESVDDTYSIYLEYIYPGSVHKLMSLHGGALNEELVRYLTLQITSGLEYLHANKIVHRDIKGANVFVETNHTVKLADFGMTKHITRRVDILSLKRNLYWMAPELIKGTIRTDEAYPVDIWSLGCTVIEMLTGNPPWSEYEGITDVMDKVLKGSPPPFPTTLSPAGRNFLYLCFCQDHTKRAPASQLLEHPFLQVQDFKSYN